MSFYILYLYCLTLLLLSQGSSRAPQSVDGGRHHGFPLRGLDVFPRQPGAEVKLADSL